MKISNCVRTRSALALGGLGLCLAFNGCFWAFMGGAAEGGYVAGQKDRGAGETVSDQWIHAKVKAALLGEGRLRSGHINVDVDKSVVTLRGLAHTEEERRLALALARSIKGVKDVKDELKLP